MTRVLTAFAALLVWAGLLAAASPIAGDWEVTVSEPDGKTKWAMSMKEEGGKLTGSLTSPGGERLPLVDLKVAGN